VKVAGGDGSELVRTAAALTGKDLFDAVMDRHALHFDYCEPHNEEEAELIAELSDHVADWADMGDELQGRLRVQIGVELSSLIRRLADHGMLVWTGQLHRRMKTPAGPIPWRIAVVLVRRMSQDEELIADHLAEINEALEARRHRGEAAKQS
jgi:hypothetical protein